jgi:hypothetical protein
MWTSVSPCRLRRRRRLLRRYRHRRIHVNQGLTLSPDPSQRSLNSVSEGLVLSISSKIDGLFAQGSRPGRTFCESVGVIDSSHWSNMIRHHIFYTRPDTEFKRLRGSYS